MPLFSLEREGDSIRKKPNPEKPLEGEYITWVSDGTGLGQEGDLMIVTTVKGVTRYSILHSYKNGTIWL